MKYMMFVCTDTEPDPPSGDPKLDDVEDWVERHDASGARVLGDALRPIADATTVRMRGGKVLVTDGPFAETREWIAGFDILECADLDEAIEIASQHPMARFGRLELRPFWDDDDRRTDRVTDRSARRPTSTARSPTRWPRSGCASSPR